MPGAGISYHPLQEKIQAAIWANYKPDEFFELDSDWMAMIIAAYRTENKVNAVLQHEQDKKAKTMRGRSGSGRRRR